MKTLMLIVLTTIAALIGACSSLSTIVQEEQEVEEGWIRLTIQDVGSLDYPSNFLELQSEEYTEMAEGYYEIAVKSDFTLQQVGLNELSPAAFDEYRRVIFKTFYLNPGEEVFRANEKYTLSRQELAEIQNKWTNQLHEGYADLNSMGLGDNKIIDSGSLEIVEVNGMFPLVWTYKRQLNDNPAVLVKQYVFWNYDKEYYLSFSYRVVDEEECREIYNRILNSFKLLGD